MKGKKLKRLTAGLLGSAIMCTATAQAAYAVPSGEFLAINGKTAGDDVIFSADFEDDSFEGFSKRGEDDTSELTISDTDAAGGKKCLSAAGRTQTWNGISFQIDKILKPGTEYVVNASVKAKNYANIMFSFQYDDAEGATHYIKLDSCRFNLLSHQILCIISI